MKETVKKLRRMAASVSFPVGKKEFISVDIGECSFSGPESLEELTEKAFDYWKENIRLAVCESCGKDIVFEADHHTDTEGVELCSKCMNELISESVK